jgi:hypothetical protein
VNQVSTNLWAVKSRSFSCRARGVAEFQCNVLRRRMRPTGRAVGDLPSLLYAVAAFCSEPGRFLFASATFVKDELCVSLCPSPRSARFVGESRLYGALSSVMVLPLCRDGVVVRSKLRKETPWKCRSRRFCARSVQRTRAAGWTHPREEERSLVAHCRSRRVMA